MKPKYHFKHNFPSEKIRNQYVDDYVEKLFTSEKIYKKYGKYRTLENWSDFEAGFIERLHYIECDDPDKAPVTHLVLYDDIYIGTIRADECTEDKVLEYARSNYSKWWYIENMDIDKIKVVKFEYKYNRKITYKARA